MIEKKTPSRHYIVTDKQSQSTLVVKATTPAQAINHAIRDRFSIRVATVDDALHIDPQTVLDATISPPVHPDRQPLTGVS